MPSSPSILTRNGLPSPLRSTPIGFQARPTAQQAAPPVQGQEDSAQDSFATEGPGPSRPPEASPEPSPESGTVHPLLSVVLGRALPVTTEPTDFSDRYGTTGSRLVVIEQPDQPADVQAEGALTVFRPGSVAGSTDHRDGFDEDVIVPEILEHRLVWPMRILGLLGGLALIVPGALMLAASHQIETQQAGRARFLSEFLSGIMITGGSVLAGLATVSGLNAIQPSLSSRIAASLRSRFTPEPPAAPPTAVELPADHLQAPVLLETNWLG